MSEWIDVCPVEDLSDGMRTFVDLGDKHVMIVCLEDNYYAIESLCSHAMFELDDAPIADCTLICPLHGAHFCLKTGEALSAPATEPIQTYSVRIDNHMIQIEDR